jgi:hypothetical protein
MELNGYNAQLFIAIQRHLLATVPAIKWIDQDFSQLESYDPSDPNSRPPVIFPCALIDFPDATHNDDGNLCQTSDVSVDIRLGFTPYSQSYSGAPESVQERALEYYGIEQQVYQALHGWTPCLTQDDDTVIEIGQPLSRRGSGTEKREDNLRVRVLRLTTSYHDATIATGISTVEVPLAVTYD